MQESLTNKWLIAVAVGLVASILGGVSSGGPKFKVNIDGNNVSVDELYLNHEGLNEYEIYFENGREGLMCELWIPIRKK